MIVNLWNLGNRLATDMKLLEKHPENKEMLEKRIERHKEDIIGCVLGNLDNNKMKEIVF